MKHKDVKMKHRNTKKLNIKAQKIKQKHKSET